MYYINENRFQKKIKKRKTCVVYGYSKEAFYLCYSKLFCKYFVKHLSEKRTRNISFSCVLYMINTYNLINIIHFINSIVLYFSDNKNVFNVLLDNIVNSFSLKRSRVFFFFIKNKHMARNILTFNSRLNSHTPLMKIIYNRYSY